MLRTLSCAVVALCLGAALNAEDQAGLKVGEPVAAFYVKDVTGPAAGETLCYRCRFKNRPVVSIFTRKVDDKVTALVKELDGTVAKHQNKDMAAFVVVLSDKPEAQEAPLKKLASEAQLNHTPLTTFKNASGPADYKIGNSDVTVMMWVDGALKVNETFRAEDLTTSAVSKIVGQTSKILN